MLLKMGYDTAVNYLFVDFTTAQIKVSEMGV